MSNSEQIKGNWNELKGKLKQNLQNLPKTICYLTGKRRRNVETTTKLGKTERN
jgi:hypothetical protein